MNLRKLQIRTANSEHSVTTDRNPTRAHGLRIHRPIYNRENYLKSHLFSPKNKKARGVKTRDYSTCIDQFDSNNRSLLTSASFSPGRCIMRGRTRWPNKLLGARMILLRAVAEFRGDS